MLFNNNSRLTEKSGVYRMEEDKIKEGEVEGEIIEKKSIYKETDDGGDDSSKE